MKFLINLLYYNRPKLVRNALESIKRLEYDDWELSIIDDGSEHKIEPIVEEMLNDFDNKISLTYIEDTIEQKTLQGGSRIGKGLNEAILESDADIVINLCDDDALISDYLNLLKEWFESNPKELYCYSHVLIYNPETENPFDIIEKRDYFTNRIDDLNPANSVDCSQVAFRMGCFKEYGLRFPFPQTRDLDASLFKQAFEKFGHCSYTGFNSQYKGIFDGQLGRRRGETEFNYVQ